ncbi:Steroid 5-alpha reductase C-terminal domain-containing protein [Madurella fahalii]|uniref:Steroid 5-alpha reductase C-terminal domain-containing protein n=1 Tax=Madurella fahalii TaxID=1157608 RepID=A0ABQ0GE57_9PEZI
MFFSAPILQTLLPAAVLAFALQTAVAIPSVLIAQSEFFYDLSGAATFVAVALLTLLLPGDGAGGRAIDGVSGNGRNWRQVAATGAVLLWAGRLGTYLFGRMLREGKDSRFDAVRTAPRRFLVVFMLQAVWVLVCVLPVAALNAVPTAAFEAWNYGSGITVTDVLGLGMYLVGFGFEIVADWQMARWVREREEKVHDEAFLCKGLWRLSRHPNYFGEVTLWTGIATVAAGALLVQPVRAAVGLYPLVVLALCYVSPAFVAFLLFKVSGISLTEKKYDAKNGKRADYQEWKKNTPVFFPKIS